MTTEAEHTAAEGQPRQVGVATAKVAVLYTRPDAVVQDFGRGYVRRTKQNEWGRLFD